MKYLLRVVIAARFAGCIFAQGAGKSSAPWDTVKAGQYPISLPAASLSDARKQAVENMIRKDPGFGKTWGCSPEDMPELFAGLQMQSIHLVDGHEVVLVEAGQGCARGGQGSNGAMWLVQFAGKTPTYLATPGDGFSGWIYSIQPAESYGYHDIVMGWHISAMESGLTYFHFDGKRYHAIGGADMKSDPESDRWTIIPK